MREKFKKFLKEHFNDNEAELFIDTFNCMCLVSDGVCQATDADPQAMQFVNILYSCFEDGYKAGKESK